MKERDKLEQEYLQAIKKFIDKELATANIIFKDEIEEEKQWQRETG